MAPKLTPTMPPRTARASRARGGVIAVVIEAEAVDERAVRAQAKEPRTRDCPPAGAASACRPRQSRSRAPSIASGTSAFLSNPAARPSGFGKLETERVDREAGSSGLAAGERGELQLRRSPPDGRSPAAKARARGRASPASLTIRRAPEVVATVRTERQRARPHDGASSASGA